MNQVPHSAHSLLGEITMSKRVVHRALLPPISFLLNQNQDTHVKAKLEGQTGRNILPDEGYPS
jgi:hypothetical protein